MESMGEMESINVSCIFPGTFDLVCMQENGSGWENIPPSIGGFIEKDVVKTLDDGTEIYLLAECGGYTRFMIESLSTGNFYHDMSKMQGLFAAVVTELNQYRTA